MTRWQGSPHSTATLFRRQHGKVFFVSFELFEGIPKSLVYSLLGGTRWQGSPHSTATRFWRRHGVRRIFCISRIVWRDVEVTRLFFVSGDSLAPAFTRDAPKRARKIPLVEIQIAGFLELFSYNIYKHIRVYRKKKRRLKSLTPKAYKSRSLKELSEKKKVKCVKAKRHAREFVGSSVGNVNAEFTWE